MQHLISGAAMAAIAIPAAAILAATIPMRRDVSRLKLGALHGLDRVARIVAAGRLVHELQRERGLSAGYLNGADGHALHMQRHQVDQALAFFLEQASLDKDEIAQSISTTRRGVDDKTLAAPVAVRSYGRKIAGLIDEMGLLVRQNAGGGLARLGTGYLNLVSAKESAGQERALWAGALGGGLVTASQKRRATELEEEQGLFWRLAQEKAGPFPSDLLMKFENAEQIVKELRKAIRADQRIDPSQWFSAATTRMDALNALEHWLENRLEQTAQCQRRVAGRHGKLVLGLATSSCLALTILGGLILRGGV